MSTRNNAKHLMGKDRRRVRTRNKIKRLNETLGGKIIRLLAHKTNQHIYAQVIDSQGNVLAAAGSLDAELKVMLKSDIDDKKGKVNVAHKVGKLVAQRAKAKGVEKVVFDRSCFKYHGRVKSLADGAREGGLVF